MTIRTLLFRCLSALPLCFFLPVLFYFEGTHGALAILLAVFLHECGHLFAFFLLGEKTPRLSLHAFGITLTPRRLLSYGREALIAFFGPLVNLATYFLCFSLDTPFASALASSSLLLAGIHLLPIIPLDGGRVSFALLHSLFGETGIRFAAALSFTALCISLFFFLYFLLYYGVGLAPFFSVLLLFREQTPHRSDL